MPLPAPPRSQLISLILTHQRAVRTLNPQIRNLNFEIRNPKQEVAREVLNTGRLARNETCPRRHHFSERCMPLRQPPAERSFSLFPPNWNPVSNDRVLPHLGPSDLEYLRVLGVSIERSPNWQSGI